MITRSPVEHLFRSATAAVMSPESNVEFGQSSLVAGLEDTTYFKALMSASLYGPPRASHEASSSSYVNRPSSSPPSRMAMRWPRARAITSSVRPAAQPPWLKPP
jgi:hypothetical protein